jgi:hypothetical protein
MLKTVPGYKYVLIQFLLKEQMNSRQWSCLLIPAASCEKENNITYRHQGATRPQCVLGAHYFTIITVFSLHGVV